MFLYLIKQYSSNMNFNNILLASTFVTTNCDVDLYSCRATSLRPYGIGNIYLPTPYTEYLTIISS